MVKIEIKNGQVILKGEFVFNVTNGVIQEGENLFVKQISFKINPECDANISSVMSNNELNLLIAEKLRVDFLKFLNDGK